MATEAHFGIEDGFWGLLARGATFRHGTQQRATKSGRQLIRDHRAALAAAEATGNQHHFAWAQGHPTPVAPTFDRLARLWDAVPEGGTLTIQWPTLDVEMGGPPGPLAAPASITGRLRRPRHRDRRRTGRR
ncbi:MAG: hypothetical protein ACRDZ2_07770 [Ilumatobacteraceae bacterium]